MSSLNDTVLESNKYLKILMEEIYPPMQACS